MGSRNTRTTPVSEAATSTDLIVLDNGPTATTSLDVAATFGKKHFQVMRDIRNLLAKSTGSVGKFVYVDIIEKNASDGPVNRSYYTLDRDATILLVMGFTGKKAAKFKQAYIAAFNEMEAKLRARAASHPTKTVDYIRQALLAIG